MKTFNTALKLNPRWFKSFGIPNTPAYFAIKENLTLH